MMQQEFRTRVVEALERIAECLEASGPPMMDGPQEPTEQPAAPRTVRTTDGTVHEVIGG